MDELLPYYNRELAYIRKLGAEFADKYPKIAARLRVSKDMPEDPHVSRLVEAFAFLTARVRRKIDDEFPEITKSLLGALYLAAMIVVMLVVGLMMGVGFGAMMGNDPQAMAAMGITMVLAMLVMFALLLPAVMAIWFAAPLVVFHAHGAVEAMKGSFMGCLKNIVPFLVYSVVMLVLAIVATIPLGLGWLALGPVFAASVYTSYRDIYLKPRA